MLLGKSTNNTLREEYNRDSRSDDSPILCTVHLNFLHCITFCHPKKILFLILLTVSTLGIYKLK